MNSRFIALLLVVPLLAGCVGSGTDDTLPPQEPDPVSGQARAVVALIDTGINPYHVEFRDPGPDAFVHPSEYLPGYPADTPALHLTLDAEDYEPAVLADCDVWAGVEPNTLYWIPGTRIVGAITTSSAEVRCEQGGPLPGRILDRGGHGTMVASRAAGLTTSVCPECKIVAVQGFTAANMRWTAEQSWIDAQSNSWGDMPQGYASDQQGRDDALWAAAQQATFVAGGNGVAGFFGVTGHPAYFDNIAGPAGIIMVGGHDNGFYTPWTMTLPHVVADANNHPAAHSQRIEEPGTGGGTSGATPFVAGTFARMLLEARATVCDFGTGARNGSLVLAGPGCDAPAEGPLADGSLSLEEAKTVLFRTAKARPVEDGWFDGPRCQDQGLCPGPYATTPVRFEDLPAGTPLYYYVGYGQVGNVTLADHIAAVLGQMPLPDRSVEDQFYGYDTMLRESFDEGQP